MVQTKTKTVLVTGIYLTGQRNNISHITEQFLIMLYIPVNKIQLIGNLQLFCSQAFTSR